MDDMNDDPIPVVTETGSGNQMAQLYADLALAQGEFQPIQKNRSVTIDMKDKATGAKKGSYQFRYADLEEITAKTRPALSKHGLATTQFLSLSTSGSGTSIFTRLLHKSGATIESEIPLVSNKDRDIKEYGAVVSYLRRYAKSALLDIAADDDLDENGQEGDGDNSQAAQAKSQDDDEFYTDEQFQKNLPSWTAAITNKKSTAERVIKMASSKRKLTEAQIAIINAIKPTETAE